MTPPGSWHNMKTNKYQTILKNNKHYKLACLGKQTKQNTLNSRLKMGITIEQHRASISSYNNSARIKYMSTFKDIFWNTSAIFVLLVRSLYLLGCIGKCQVHFM